MKFIVLGGRGFLGSTIMKALGDIETSECTSISTDICDLRDEQQIKEVLCPILPEATVVYAAGIPRARSDNFEAFVDNTKMVDNLIKAFREYKPRSAIFLSSVEVYGDATKLPITEETPIQPMTLYGIGKVTAELMLRQWHRNQQVPLAVLRLPGVYGDGDKGRGFIGALKQHIENGEVFSLFGDGKEKRDYLFVRDIGSVVRALHETEFDELTLNVATGSSYTLLEIMNLAFSNFGASPYKILPRSGEASHLWFDASFFKQALPGVNLTPLSEGLRRYDE